MRYDGSVTDLENLAEASRTTRSRFEPNWYVNLAFYIGDQWSFWNQGRLDQPNVPSHWHLVTDNRIMPVVMTRVAKMTKQRPIWTVTPNSPEDQDVYAATLGEFVIEERWKSMDMHSKLITALEWAEICGSGFWKITWDPTVGERANFLLGPDGRPVPDQMGKPMKISAGQEAPEGAEIKTVAQGDVVLDARSPFEILQDPLGDVLSDCEWIIEEVIQSEEYVRQRHDIELEGDTDVSPGPTTGRYFASSQLQGSAGNYKGVKVSEFWAKPSSRWPKGKRCVWAKQQILYEGDNPYEELPYAMFTGVPVPGRFWPTCLVEQLRGPQIELNKIKSQIAMNAQRVGNPSLLKDRMSNVSYEGIPGEVVEFDNLGGGPPGFLIPPEMPVYVREQIDRIEGSIREISGQHEVTSSQVPAGVTAASAINLLLEQDDTRLGPAIYDMEAQLSKSGQMVLKLIAKYYDDERTLKMAGEDGDWDIRAFKGGMLRNNTSVEVQAGSAMPVSKAAKQAAMQQTLTLFIQNGQALDQRSIRKFFKDFEAGGLEHLFGDMTEGIRQVKRENRYMYQGQPIPINSYDDDQLHISEHEEEMRSARFFRQSQDMKKLMEGHVSLHRDRITLAQENAQKAQMQQMMEMEQMKAQFAQQGEQQKVELEAAKTQQELVVKGEEHQMDMTEKAQDIDIDRLRHQQDMEQRAQEFEAAMKLKKIEADTRRRQTQGDRNGR